MFAITSTPIPITNIETKTMYLYIVFSIYWIWATLSGISESPNNVLQVENEIIFSLDTLINFLTVLFIAKTIRLKYEKVAKIHNKIKIESTLFKKFPSSICLESKNNEFIGTLVEFVSNKLSIDITVRKSNKNEIKYDIIDIFLKFSWLFRSGFT